MNFRPQKLAVKNRHADSSAVDVGVKTKQDKFRADGFNHRPRLNDAGDCHVRVGNNVFDMADGIIVKFGGKIKQKVLDRSEERRVGKECRDKGGKTSESRRVNS